jgi:hypothetical protein
MGVNAGVADGVVVAVSVSVADGDGSAVSTRLIDISDGTALGDSVTMSEAVLATEHATSVNDHNRHNASAHFRQTPGW